MTVLAQLGGTISRLSGQLTGAGAEITTRAPFTGDPIATFPGSTPGDVFDAYALARKAQLSWAATPPAVRARPFVRLHDLVLGNAEVIDLVQLENGKARNDAFEETADVAGLALYYGRHAARFLKPRRRKGAIPLATRTVELRQPKGVVAIISPWNYPLSLAVCDVIPALLAGNAVVHKPDTQTVLTALYARDLLVRAGLPADLWQIVVGEPAELGQPVIDGADHVCFTGSTAAGRRIAQACAQRLIGCTLELGGKNPMIVLDDADLDQAANGAARACFSTAGQLCLSAERIYVAEQVYDEFVPKLVSRTRELTLGRDFDFGYSVGSLTSARQLATVQRHVAEAEFQGAKVLAGGTGRTSGRTSSSRRCWKASPRTWSCTPRRPSARSRRSTRSATTTKRCAWPTTPSTASTPASGPATSPAAAASPPGYGAARSTSTRASAPRTPRTTRRWAG